MVPRKSVDRCPTYCTSIMLDKNCSQAIIGRRSVDLRDLWSVRVEGSIYVFKIISAVGRLKPYLSPIKYHFISGEMAELEDKQDQRHENKKRKKGDYCQS